MKKLIILFSLLFLVTGCMGYHELNELRIINNIYLKKTTAYETTFNEVLPKKDDFTYSKKYLKHYYSNKSLNKIFNKDKKMYFSHLKYIVINTNFTKQDLIKLVNILKKKLELRENFYIFISNNYLSLKDTDIFKELLNNKKILNFYNIKKKINNKEKVTLPIVKISNNVLKIIKYKSY